MLEIPRKCHQWMCADCDSSARSAFCTKGSWNNFLVLPVKCLWLIDFDEGDYKLDYRGHNL